MPTPAHRRPRPIATALATAVLLICALVLTPTATAAPSPGGRAVDTEALEQARLVDRVTTPSLTWTACGAFQCASAAVPLDYRRPHGAQIRVALLKVAATDPAHRIGSLFLNPGGPGGSGKDIARRAADFLSPSVRARFDLIGMDPRGTNDSTRVQCYPDAEGQARDTAPMGMVFPVGAAAEAGYGAAAGRLARACSTAGRPLSAAMSTAEVARDLDLLRRAVGDARMTYLGWSYGSYLGQVYANMFPGRVRAVAIDGVVDAAAWRGNPATADLPMSVRMDSGRGSYRALHEVLRRCGLAGAACPLQPDPQAAFDSALAELRAHPITLTGEDGSTEQVTYSTFVHDVLLTLYLPETAEQVPAVVAMLRELQTTQTSTAARRAGSVQLSRRLDAVRALSATRSSAPLANDYELNAAVSCSDSRNPERIQRWRALAPASDARSPYFGRFWLWQSAVCAGRNWTARDVNAYTGRLDRWTAAPILVVGNTWDPATNYEAAQAVSHRMPNSGLLLSDSWGHTAYGTSGCVTAAMDRYLLAGTLPQRGTRCTGDVQPFAG